MRKKLSKLWDKLDGWFAFFLTFIGVLTSNYLMELQTGKDIVINLDIGRLIIAGIVALAFTLWQESRGNKGLENASEDEKERHIRGKRNNSASRMFTALIMGLFWPNMIENLKGLLNKIF